MIDPNTDPTYLGLLARVLARPGCDNERLYLADRLDELRHGERAEFIRVQCELARRPGAEDRRVACRRCGGDGYVHPPPEHRRCRSCNGTGVVGDKAHLRYARLATRQRELLAQNWRVWLTLPQTYISASWPAVVGGATTNVEVDGSVHTFFRGFVESVTCTLDALLGGECPVCDEHGQPIDEVDECSTCGNTRRVGGIARELFAAHPVTRVTITDREPWQIPGRSGAVLSGWYWICWSPTLGSLVQPQVRQTLPPKVFNLLSGELYADFYGIGSIKRYPTREEAIEAVSDAMVLLGREEAGVVVEDETT